MAPKSTTFSFCLLLLLLIPTAGHATYSRISLKTIELNDDVPSNSVQRIFQDSEGLMWFGTSDGLCRYDGYKTIVFRSDYNHPDLLTQNQITCIAEDKEGRLWIGTGKGITLLDKKTYTLSHFENEHVRNKYIRSIAVSSDSTIWVGAGNSLFTFNTDFSLKSDYRQHTSIVGQVSSIYEDTQGDIWICRPKTGLFKYERNSDSFIDFPPIDSFNTPFRMYQDNRGQYWICTWGNGLYRFFPHLDKETMYQKVPAINQGTQQPEYVFFSIVQDDTNGYIWAMSLSGIYTFRYTSDNTIEEVDVSSLLENTNNIFSEIIKDRNGNLWIGAFHEGALLLCFDQPYVQHIDIPDIKKQLGQSANILIIYEDSKGLIWFNQNRYGMGIYDPHTHTTRLFKDFPELKNLYSFESITCFMELPGTNDMLLGSGHSDQIYRVRKEKDNLRITECIDLHVLFPGVGHPLHFFTDSKENLWVGTSNGLIVKPHDTSSFRMVCHYTGKVTAITEDSHGTIWISSDKNGLFRIPSSYDMNWAALTITHYQKESGHLPDNSVQSIAADKEGRVWIGLSDGNIWAYDNAQQEFLSYTHQCGMKGHAIQDIVVDDRGHIWISTTRQITEYNPANDALSVYNNSDGLTVNSFIKNSVFKSTLSDRIYFGGNMGIASFRPSPKLDMLPGEAEVLVTDIKIHNQSVLHDSSIHNKFDFSAKRLTLDPKDIHIEIDFSSLNYSHPSKVQYAYKLSGVDKDWVYAGSNRQFATYNQLKKGDYTFLLKATDENKLWSKEVATLTIHKRPAFYETWWAYLIYMCTIVLITALIIRFFFNRVQLRNELRIAQIEIDKSEELTQTKLRYFTNISHDFLTPLTIISCTIDDIETTLNRRIPQFETMRSNVGRLRRLLQQILDFRKIEAGHIKLKITHGDIALFIKDICFTHFAPMIKKKDITFSFTSTPMPEPAFFDADKVDKIVFNLLSNAFKYTPNGGSIEVSLESMARDGHTFLTIRISDSGIGIDEADVKEIFTRFYFNKRSGVNQTNGIGLSVTKDLIELHHGNIQVSSKLNEGTTFTIELPIDENSYTESERIPSSVGIAEANTVKAQSDSADDFSDIPEGAEKQDTTLLLVEDNEELLTTVRSILSKQYTVLTAGNGVEALKQVSKANIDIIVSDVMMPEMDGLELCRTLKNNIETSHIPILLLTAKNSMEDRIECYNAGADGYISKPFDLKVLEARLNNFLLNRRKRQKEFKTDVGVNISKLEYTTLDEQFLQKMIALIEAHIAEPDFDNITFAQHMHMSKSSLYRKIKTLTGLSPVEFIRNIRLKYACTLLRDKSVTVSEVAYATGFTDPKYFSSCFKSEFNMPPSEYQKTASE